MKEPTIREYLKAGYPCLFLRTVEPLAAEQLVRDALIDLKMGSVDFGVWKATTGLLVNRADAANQAQERSQDLLDALGFIETQEQPIVAVFHNVRQFVTNYQIIQQLIDTIMAARLKGSHVFLVGPELDLPMELKNLVTFIDIPLPNRDRIQSLFVELVRAYEEDIELPTESEERETLLRAAANAAVGLDLMGAENAIALSMATEESVALPIIQAQIRLAFIPVLTVAIETVLRQNRPDIAVKIDLSANGSCRSS